MGIDGLTSGAGWIRDENGAWRRETKHHMGRRLPGFDYRRPGYYVITIVLANRRSRALGELVVKAPTAGAAGARRTEGAAENWISIDEARELHLEPEEIEAKIVFSELGRAIFSHFRRMGEFTPGLKPTYCAVMPDHLHLLVEIASPLERPLGNAIGGFKTGCEKIFARLGGKGKLFAEGFVDEIVLRAGQLPNEFEYLLDNPRRLAVKKLFPEYFKVLRQLRVDFRLAPKGHNGQTPAISPQLSGGRGADRPMSGGRGADRPMSGGREAGREGLSSPGVCSAPAAPAVGWFSAIGNAFLLTRPDIRQVQCSRRFFAYARDEKGRPLKTAEPAVKTREFDEKLAAALEAARGGAVIISPCISHGEREIARRVFAAGGRLITLQNVGFSPLYKPGGKLFERCAAGNLLMLAPIAWPYQPDEKPMSRHDAQVLNRIAQLIAGEGAAEIDYKGAVMANVDLAVAEAIEQSTNL